MTAVSRRQFVQGVGVAGLALATGCGRLPEQAQQPGKVPRVGVLLGSVSTLSPEAEVFRQGLREHGYIEGSNAHVEWR